VEVIEGSQHSPKPFRHVQGRSQHDGNLLRR